MQKKPIYRILYTIFIVLIVLSFTFMFRAIGKRTVDNSFDDRSVRKWDEGWTIQIDSDDAFVENLPVNLECEKNAAVSMEKYLPTKLGDFNCMLVESKRQEVYVYVAGVLRASYTDEGQKIGSSLPSSYLMVPLYTIDAGKIIRVELTSNTYYSGKLSSIYIGNGMSIILSLVKENVIWLAVIAAIAIIGLVCLTCFILYKNTFKNSTQFIHLFWFSLFTCIWCFSQIEIRQVFVRDLSVCESIGQCCFMLIPFVILLISNYFSNYIHPVFHQLCFVVAIVNFLGQNIVHTAMGVDYFQMQAFTQLFIFWILTTCIGGCVLDTISARVTGRNLVVVGFLGQTLGIIAEAVCTAMNMDYTRLGFYMIGALVFMIAITLNTFFDLKKVQQEMKDAENANKAKSMFLATMSHEIRTPINVVLGMNEMILREAQNSTIREYAGNISEAGKSLLSLVNDILDFSKIESGKMDIVCVDYYLKSVLNDLIMMTKTRIGNKDIRLVLDIDETIPAKYYGDEVRLKQILTNLLTNSVKYTKSGTITLSVKKVDRDGEDISLRFSVKDTGMGMKPENIEKLLSSTFIRFDEKKNRNIEGTGLGISITRQLLELMGSKLEIESVYGESSDFHFTLKQRVVDETAMGPVEQKDDVAKPKRKNTFMAPGATILAVDDTKTNLLVIKGLLKPYGMNVETVSSGAECIAKCKENHYDIIFMDHMMPEMDGIETLQKLKAEKLLTADTKVVALTANAISGAEEMYISNGFDGYLTKPIDVVSIDACIRKNLPNDKINDFVQ